MTEVERYLFDLQGYMIVEDVLDAQAVAELNRLIGRSRDGTRMSSSAQGRLHTGGFFDVGPAPLSICSITSAFMPLLKVILRRRLPA